MFTHVCLDQFYSFVYFLSMLGCQNQAFLFVLYFLVSCFYVSVGEQVPRMHVISMRTKVKSCIRRYLPTNLNSELLCCLVCLFHMFYLVLNPLFFLFLFICLYMLAQISLWFCLCFEHARLLELGFLCLCSIFCFSFWVSIIEQVPCTHVMNMCTQVKPFGCIRRYLPRNPNSNLLCSLVCLFHMFYLVLNPFFMIILI